MLEGIVDGYEGFKSGCNEFKEGYRDARDYAKTAMAISFNSWEKGSDFPQFAPFLIEAVVEYRLPVANLIAAKKNDVGISFYDCGMLTHCILNPKQGKFMDDLWYGLGKLSRKEEPEA
ncbi:carboxypeptidase M32 [Candidatus Woesearchaeota archaeon]|nr:carboxypeptidase M32 [Candidatus Woesearchaeota archaeon]